MARRRHKRTESQAVTELENVFKSVDLEGDGNLDKAAFQTAMFSLDYFVEDEKMDDLWAQVGGGEDVTEIPYEDFLKFIKNHKGNNDVAAKIIEQAQAAPTSMPASVPPVGANIPQVKASPPKKKMDPKKKSVIQRAVIVIKKAAMKNISREEVVEFLKDKGLKGDDINYAYEKAAEQAMSPDERLRYFKAQVSSKEKELKEQKQFCRHLSDQNAEKSKQITELQALLEKATGLMFTLPDPQAGKTRAPAEASQEVQKALTKLQSDKVTAPAAMRAVYDTDIEKLGKVKTCLNDGRAMLAHLILNSTEAVDKTALVQTNVFLAECGL